MPVSFRSDSGRARPDGQRQARRLMRLGVSFVALQKIRPAMVGAIRGGDRRRVGFASGADGTNRSNSLASAQATTPSRGLVCRRLHIRKI